VEKATPSDNTLVESFFKTFKSELIYANKLKAREHMRFDVFDVFDVFEYIESA